MNLYILRHGLAVERGAPGFAKDAERPLTPKGERKLWQVAEAMEALELSFDLILTSPYVRARQTAEIVAEAFNRRKRLEMAECLTPGGDMRELIGLIKGITPLPENVLLVGHEPYLSELISLLASGSNLSLEMKKGGLCKLEAQTLKHGRCASLAWLLTPRQMGLMA
jgi:phosphohistidine phosphatase